MIHATVHADSTFAGTDVRNLRLICGTHARAVACPDPVMKAHRLVQEVRALRAEAACLRAQLHGARPSTRNVRAICAGRPPIR